MSSSATDGEVIKTTSKATKNLYDDEDELDYEEEVDFGKQNTASIPSHDNGEEEGQISDEGEVIDNVQNKEKDEGKSIADIFLMFLFQFLSILGELDDEEDLEEGEVKEDGEIQSDEDDKTSTLSSTLMTNNGRARITAPDNKGDPNKVPNDERSKLL